MSSVRKRWLVGKGVTGISITPLTLQADNSFLAGTTQSLTGVMEDIAMDYGSRLEEINALDRDIDNNVIISRATSIRLREIMQHATGSYLADLSASYDHFRVVWIRGGKTYTFDGVLGGFSEPVVKGKHVAELVVNQVDLTTANPLYA